MRAVLAAALCLFGTAGQAGVAAYDACLGDGYEARVMAAFVVRFPHETCDSPASCDPWLVKSAEALTRAACRADALADCASAKCRLGLEGRWQAEAAALRLEIDTRLSALDLATLPALQARRLSDPARWKTPVSCIGDAVTCQASAAAQELSDLERIATELEGLVP